MATLEELKEELAAAGSNLGAVAGEIRERMYAATVAGELEKAKAAEALYNEYTYLAMTAIRTQIAAVDDSPEMQAALAALRVANVTLNNEKARVRDLANSLDGAINVVNTVTDALGKIKSALS